MTRLNSTKKHIAVRRKRVPLNNTIGTPPTFLRRLFRQLAFWKRNRSEPGESALQSLQDSEEVDEDDEPWWRNSVQFFTGATNVNVSNSVFNIVFNDPVGLHPSGYPFISGIIVIDATGRHRDVSMDCANSYTLFLDLMKCIVGHDESQIQTRFLEAGMVDLSIDLGDHVIALRGQENWHHVRPGRKIVMAVILPQRVQKKGRYQCPKCQTWTDQGGATASIIDCNGCDVRFHVSEEEAASDTKRTDQAPSATESDLKLLRNFHLRHQSYGTSPSPESDHDTTSESWDDFVSYIFSSPMNATAEDTLQLGTRNELEGRSEAAHHSGTEWKWDSPMDPLEQPWAIYNP